MTRATVTLPAGYLAREVTVFARDNGDGTSSIEAFDAGGALWPVMWDGVEIDRFPGVCGDQAPYFIAPEGKLFALPVQRF